MKRSTRVLGLSIVACALTMIGESNAKACGGCFHPPPPPTQSVSDITDERMLLSVSPSQTTLYDQIEYTGNPSSFAWVLPIKGTVDIGLSADVLFDSIDALTTTTINAPATNCAGPPQCGNAFASASGFDSAEANGSASTAGVTVSKQENVGPYETVQLHATDPNALNNWLTQNGFTISADVQPVIDEYVKEGFDFLAMKLLPNQGVQSMRPVRVTMPGASLALPLRMAAIGTGTTTGITIWVVSDGRYEPQNFPFFHIDDKDLVWDFNAEQSNYTTLRQQNEAALNGSGWEIESSIDIAQTTISQTILSGGQVYGNYAGYYGAGVASPSFTPSNAGDDYLPSDSGDTRSSNQTAEQVRALDIASLFGGLSGPNVRVTRIRSDISHAAMTTDFVLQASADQSELSNNRNVTQSINLTCPSYPGCGLFGGCSEAPAKETRDHELYAVLVGMLGLVTYRIAKNRKRMSDRERS